MKFARTANVSQIRYSGKPHASATPAPADVRRLCPWTVARTAMIAVALLLALSLHVYAASNVTALHVFTGLMDGAFPAELRLDNLEMPASSGIPTVGQTDRRESLIKSQGSPVDPCVPVVHASCRHRIQSSPRALG